MNTRGQKFKIRGGNGSGLAYLWLRLSTGQIPSDLECLWVHLGDHENAYSFKTAILGYESLTEPGMGPESQAPRIPRRRIILYSYTKTKSYFTSHP